MPITRTPMVDDDGSGTTGTILNNAWKQEFYNQIDGVVQGVQLTWTATSPVGPLGTGYYVRTGALVFLSVRLTWPANSDPGQAIFSLPVPAQSLVDGGLVQSYGPMDNRYWIANNADVNCLVLNAATGVTRTNQEMSGQLVIVHGTYFGG